MIDSFDYKEPQCALCSGKEFYNPNQNLPDGRIPIDRIISKIDECFNKNQYLEAGRLLEYWRDESIVLKDTVGELSIQSELVGYYRKVNRKEDGLKAISRALELVDLLEQAKMSSGATIFINCATAYKAFDIPEKALPLYELAEKIYSTNLSRVDVRFGGLYNNMAITFVALGRYEDAEKTYCKAVDVMKDIKEGKADLAITYVNMAHLYDLMDRKKRITECLFMAYDLLNDEDIKQNGYYAYVCEKCAPSYEYFGYKIISEQLKKVSVEIYERA